MIRLLICLAFAYGMVSLIRDACRVSGQLLHAWGDHRFEVESRAYGIGLDDSEGDYLP